MNPAMKLTSVLQAGQATVAIVGQGYVGLPLAMAIVSAGFTAYGIDVDQNRVKRLGDGESYIVDVPSADVAVALSTGRYHPTTDFRVIKQCEVVVICVPTPLRESKDPDVSYIRSATEKIIANAHPGLLVILESTTYPGTTEELVADEFTRHGYRLGEDVFACFSPERVDPGNEVYKTVNTPKVIGGVTPACTDLGVLFYERVMQRVIPVSSARVAEMVKLLENTFRAVNIGLVNELALMSERMDIDIWEVVEAAGTKPFGFMPFYPGPGVGGHCIPLDPLYLAWKAKTFDFHSRFIELASETNGNMPRHVVRKVADALNLDAKSVRNSRILVLGMAYKRDVDDLRESPSLEIFKLLQLQGAQVDFHDPHIDSFRDGEAVVYGVPMSAHTLGQYDCVVLATNHSAFDYPWVSEHSRLIVDTRNAFRGLSAPHILRVGTATPAVAEWTSLEVGNQEVAATKG